MTGELLNQNNWKPESSIKSTARESSLTVQTGVLPQITPSVCLNAETSPRMRKELPWLCTMLSACIGNRKLGHQSTAMNVLQVTKQAQSCCLQSIFTDLGNDLRRKGSVSHYYFFAKHVTLNNLSCCFLSWAKQVF